MSVQVEVDRLLTTDQLASNIYLQYLLCANMKQLLPVLSTGQREEYLKKLCALLPRLQGVPDPTAVVERIINLKDEDIYAALKFSYEKQGEYEYLPEETIYPSSGWIGSYLRWARAGNAPLGYHFWACMLLMGAVCQRRVFFPGGKHVWMNQYVVLGGLKSCGKGQAFEPAVHIMEMINKILSPTLQAERENIDMLINLLPADATQEALISNLASKIRIEPERNEENPDIVHINLDPNAERNKIDATGVIPLDEMATFFGRDAWAVAKKAPWLSTLKDTNRYAKETKSGGLEILNNTALSLLACCAPDWMHSTIDADLFGGGFMDRCTWVYRNPVWARRERVSIVNAIPKDPLQAEVLAEWLIEHILRSPLKIPVLMTQEADELYAEFHRELVMAEKAAFLEYGSDADGRTSNRAGWTTVQVASLLSMSEGEFPPVTIELYHLKHAIEIVMAEEDSMATFMGEASRRTDVKVEIDIMKFIGENGGCAKLSDITKKFTVQRSSKVTKAFIESLLDQDRVEECKFIGGSGRPPVIYRIKGHSCERCQVK